MCRQPDLKSEHGSALVISLVLMTLLMGLAVSVDMAVTRAGLTVRGFEMRTKLDLITDTTLTDIVDRINAGNIPLQESGNLMDTAGMEFHETVKTIALVRDDSSGVWQLIIDSSYEEGRRRVRLKKSARMTCTENICEIINIIYL